jgi:hypothetical protein
MEEIIAAMSEHCPRVTVGPFGGIGPFVSLGSHVLEMDGNPPVGRAGRFPVGIKPPEGEERHGLPSTHDHFPERA